VNGRPLPVRRTRRRPVVLATASLLLAALASACSGDAEADGPRALALAATEGLEGWDGFVQLPHGQVRFTVGAAAEGLGGSRGWSVPVVWHFLPGGGVPLETARLVQGAKDPVELSVLVDEERSALGRVLPAPAADAGRQAALVPVEDDVALEDVVLAVEFDGVVQRLEAGTGLRDTDQAAPLYALKHPVVRMRCRTAVRPRVVQAGSDCRASARAVPWVADLGWAGHRRSWWVVDLDTTAVSVTDAVGTRYAVRGMVDASTVESEPALLAVGESFGIADGQLRTLRVYRAAAGRAPSIDVVRVIDWYDDTPTPGLRDDRRRAPALDEGERMVLVGRAEPRR